MTNPIMPEIILASACVLGIQSAYNGKPSKRLLNKKLQPHKNYRFIPFCPEQIAGFSTPRPPVEIIGGDGSDVLSGKADVITKDGRIVTRQFIDALDDILLAVQWVQPDRIVLQQRSPSCSCAGVYNGSFTHTLIPGDGVVAAYLRQKGYHLVDIMSFNISSECSN
jgi:uncharacterized protein YbbK (DUF523 family)